MNKFNAASLADILLCPECSSANVESTSEVITCSACKFQIPVLSGIPILIKNSQHFLQEWKLRWAAWVQALDGEIDELKIAMTKPSLLESTTKRLSILRKAKIEQKNIVHSLLAPLAWTSSKPELAEAFRHRLPLSQPLMGYYANILRDWSWNNGENEASLNCILNVLGDNKNLGRTLILGSGAGRLAYDIHEKLKPTQSLCVDLNPFLAFVHAAMMKGEKIDFYEFPTVALSLGEVAVKRKCQAPTPAGDNLICTLGDATSLPFKSHSFDTIITPWFIDILPMDTQLLAQSIASYLKPQGRWINFGSLGYAHKDETKNYTKEEIEDILKINNFKLNSSNQDTIAYMQSPSSCHKRNEVVFSFSATSLGSKTHHPHTQQERPLWLDSVQSPVPQLKIHSVMKQVHEVQFYVFSLVDGKRSLADMAPLLAKRFAMTEAEALSSLKNFFLTIYEENN